MMTDNNNQNDPDGDNIVKFVPRVETKHTQTKEKLVKSKHPPMLNIPPVTKILTGILLGIYALQWISGFFIANIDQFIAVIGGFISGSWTGSAPFMLWTPLTPFTSIFLHGSWMHVGMNALMLVAIGSGAEKSLGTKKYLLVFFGSSFIALLTHLAFSPTSDMPVIGASGGVSGLFGAMIYAMKAGENPGINPNMMPVILLWVGISVLFGLMGAPDGSNIAWIAHIGGFLGGIGIAAYLFKKQHR